MLEHASNANACLVVHAIVGYFLVHVDAGAQEVELCFGSGVDQLAHLFYRHLGELVERGVFLGGNRGVVAHDVFAVALHEHNVGVGVGNHRRAYAVARNHVATHVDAPLAAVDCDVDLVIGDNLNCFLCILGSEIFENLKRFVGVAYYCANGEGIVQSFSLEVGYRDRHAVFVHIGVDHTLDFVDLAAYGLHGCCSCYGYTSRLGAPQCRSHVALQECKHFAFV